MTSTVSKVDDPCQECRVRHLKCDNNRPKCLNCERSKGSTCTRNDGKVKFRHGSRAKYDTIFGKDQPWLSQGRNGKIQFVDQGPELENSYAHGDDGSPHTQQGANRRSDSTDRANGSDSTGRVNRSDSTGTQSTAAKRSTGTKRNVERTLDPPDLPNKQVSRPSRPSSGVYDPVRSFYVLPQQPKPSIYADFGNVTALGGSNDVPRRVEAEYRRLADTQAAAIPPEELLTPEVWKQDFYWPNDFTTTQCACLMRYFIEQLAPWFDVGDPERTFALVVPQRARRCPPLLNAIFTAAARHLAAKPAYKNQHNVIVYRNTELPSLTVSTAIYYHQACIAYFKKLGQDEVSIQDENLLAAAIILRYYEELDHTLSGDESAEHAPKFVAFNIFVNAQARQPHPQLGSPLISPLANWPSALELNSPASMVPPLRSRSEVIAELRSFRHACFRVALRQETTAAFLKQQSISTSLPDTWSLLSMVDPLSARHDEPDFVHSDRHLLHCAQVLQYCFGTTSAPTEAAAAAAATTAAATAATTGASSPQSEAFLNSGTSSVQRYRELKEYQRNWRKGEPYSFQPIHYLSGISTPTSFTLPQIWYISEIHAFGLSYLDLADILLTVYDPRLPRLGPNAAREQQRVARTVREIVVRVCGAAMSNPDSESTCMQAYLAIVVCGEHFGPVGRKEQEALWAVLEQLEARWGWPTGRERDDLAHAWGWS